MIAVDTNILVYAHRRDSPWHARASELIADLTQRSAEWALPWPCLYEFIGIATHPRIFGPPSTWAEALAQADAWQESPNLTMLGETEHHWSTLKQVAGKALTVGSRIHDAHIAALCLQHGVAELWSADRDFQRFPELKVRNPLVA